MEYTFLLRCRLPDSQRPVDEVVERLGAAGCDDALVGTGIPGRIALEFIREAESAEAALVSALTDVNTAIPGIQITEIEPDLVGLSDVAKLVDVSRQNLHKFVKGHPDSFPTPVHEGTSVIWHLSDVLAWLKANQAYEVSPSLEEMALAAKQANLLLRARDLEPRVSRALAPFIS